MDLHVEIPRFVCARNTPRQRDFGIQTSSAGCNGEEFGTGAEERFVSVDEASAVDRNLDREQRPGGMNAAEAVFIFTMLNGVRINAVGNLH